MEATVCSEILHKMLFAGINSDYGFCEQGRSQQMSKPHPIPPTLQFQNRSQIRERALPWINGDDDLHPQQHRLRVTALGSQH